MRRTAGLNRRQFLTRSIALATTLELQKAAWALGFSSATPVCKLAAEQEVGPYYVPGELLRADIRESKPGVPLSVRLAVLDARTCKPLERAAVDVWHCDALGLYSGYTKMNPTGFGPGGPSFGPPPGFDPQHPDRMLPPPAGFDPEHPENRPGPPEGFGPPPVNKPTDRLTFLRGIQFTDVQGAVTFHTIFPGYYMGRTNHIHFKVRVGGRVNARRGSAGQTYIEGHTAHTGQVFFPEAFAAELMTHEPYAKHTIHRTTQTEDQVFEGQHGSDYVATLRPQRQNANGAFSAELVVAVDPDATPAEVGPRGPGGPSAPPREH